MDEVITEIQDNRKVEELKLRYEDYVMVWEKTDGKQNGQRHCGSIDWK